MTADTQTPDNGCWHGPECSGTGPDCADRDTMTADTPTPDYFTPEALVESAQHNLTDSRTRSQLFWAAAEIEQLQAALGNWLDGVEKVDPDELHPNWCWHNGVDYHEPKSWFCICGAEALFDDR